MRLSDPYQDWSLAFSGSKGPNYVRWTPHAVVTAGAGCPVVGVNLTNMYPGRTSLTTRQAAALLGRAQQTLHKWATYQTGPLEPKRVNGRLLWPINELQKLI